MMYIDITGVILAGGAGQRVGGLDKGLLPWSGAPLVSHVAAVLESSTHSLIISCNRNADKYRQWAGKVIESDIRDAFGGPLCGLEAAAPFIETSITVVAPCDTPRLPENYVERLCSPLVHGARRNVEISFASDGGRDHYLCMAVMTSSLPSLRPFLDGGDRAVKDWIKEMSAVRVEFPNASDAFRNLNQLDDFAL